MANQNDSILNCNNNETSSVKRKNSVEKSSSGEDYKNTKATTSSSAHQTEQQTRREENPFSFKHFLNRDTTTSSTAIGNNSNLITSTNVTTTTTSSSSNESNFNNNSNSNFLNDTPINSTRSVIVSSGTPNSLESPLNSGTPATTFLIVTSPSVVSASSSSISYKTSTGARPKVPQSTSVSNNYHNNPSTTSYQQQYSLPSTSISTTSMSSLISGGNVMKRSPRFSSFDSQASLAEYAGSGLNGNDGSGNYRDAIGEFNENDLIKRETPTIMDNFLSNRKSTNRSNSSGIPQSSSKNYSGNGSGSGSGGMGCSRPPNSEFSNVLPDFVQDHWMDQWYYNDMNLSSPPNSPISPSPVDFVEDLPGGGSGTGGVSGLIGGNISNVGDKCQTLPDFLSDGPIIHSSSARLADVAAGLPPDLDSPEDNSPSLQISRLRLENERLRRELDESRLSLAEQTRRAGELERRLEQINRNSSEASAYDRNLSLQNSVKIDEHLDQNKKCSIAAQSQISKLKQQVKQLTTEINVLRRENESLRENGAVGGDRVTRRPSRTQQLSRDLMRAASNAENNLRQLLSGVENLRLMAATIENMDKIAIDSTNQSNSIFNEEILSDSDVDFDDFSGPAL